MTNIIHGTYDIDITAYDWGCAVSRIDLSFDSPLPVFDKDHVSVEEHKMETNFGKVPFFPIEEVRKRRNVLDAYLSDENGNRCEGPCDHAVIELGVSPSEGSPLLFSMHTQFNTWSKPYELLISVKSDGTKVEIDPVYQKKTTAADIFRQDTFTASDGIVYPYALYEPKENSDRLVVWLHGLGEGGIEDTDPSVTCLANKVTSLVSDAFQDTVGKTNVLVPQCPTYWMDNTGKGAAFFGNGIKADNTSFYETSLVELIRTYQKEHQIQKTVICGCSNGGFMTLLLGMDHPELMDGIVPICEALPDVYVTDEQIMNVKDKPMYFVYSKDDDVVDPKKHEIPTLKRLKKAGAEDLYLSTTEHVIDTSGKYKDKKGKAHRYSGHWSWIYFFNNECNAEGKKAWDFIADCLK